MSEYGYTILGSASGLPQANRGSSGTVVEAAGTLALIDCGGSVCQGFLRTGFEVSRLDRIFITHTHPDHVVELPLLIQMLKLAGRKNPVDLYLPEEFVEPFERMVEAMYLFRARLPFELRIVGYEDHFSFEGPFILRAVANRHLQKYAPIVAELGLPSRLQSYSFDLEINGKRLFHSGDVGGFEDVELHLQGHDYAVIEAAHLDLNRLFAYAQSGNVGQYIITHVLSDEQAAEIEMKGLIAEIANLVVARDGLRLEL